MKAQTAPNKDVQREIADLGEVGMGALGSGSVHSLSGLKSKTIPVLELSLLSLVLF